jgi:GNAT superfamily N-acetyltransferase
MMDIDIRSAGVKDKSIIRDLLLSAWQADGYSVSDLSRLIGTKYDPAVTAKTIIDHCEDPASSTKCWIAFVQQKPAGIITTKDIDGGVFVHERFRNMGVGRALVVARNKFLAQQGKDEAEAHVELFNSASIAMHKKLGYEFDANSLNLLSMLTKPELSDHLLSRIGRPVLRMTKKLEI